MMFRRKPVHPGEILREEFLKPRGWSAEYAASKLDRDCWSRRDIVGLSREQFDLQDFHCTTLARLFGTTPEFWANLGYRYRKEMWGRIRIRGHHGFLSIQYKNWQFGIGIWRVWKRRYWFERLLGYEISSVAELQQPFPWKARHHALYLGCVRLTAMFPETETSRSRTWWPLARVRKDDHASPV